MMYSLDFANWTLSNLLQKEDNKHFFPLNPFEFEMNGNTSVPSFYILYALCILIFISNFQYISNFNATLLVEISVRTNYHVPTKIVFYLY